MPRFIGSMVSMFRVHSKSFMSEEQAAVDRQPKAVDRSMFSRTSGSPKLSTGACFLELQVTGLYTSVDRSLIAVDRSIQTSKLKFCLQPSVDRPFLAVDKYNPELNFCTLSCLNPC
ncbi:hypothetical protein Taro_005445 [Colocasia esculenta]|uniref:Uncharacterized protein n=1 Tax=Colocasia esculenta TaxID=4460 RepID=A0A843TL16_COLES|nr:hypothetical protein [Colocasia esculenta]